MRSKIRSLGQAGRNTQDGVSLLQVAEGNLSTISANAIRLRELAMMAANDTVGAPERSMASREFESLKNEISRVTQVAEFNGTKVLSSQDKQIDLQIGVNNSPKEDRLSYNLNNLMKKVKDTSLVSTGILNKASAQSSLGALDNFLQDIGQARAAVGSLSKSMESIAQGISISGENHSASRSKIADTDYAKASAEKAAAQIGLAAGTSVLVQTNNIHSSAVRLLD